MSRETSFSVRSNPLSSRYIRPGAIPFFFPEGCSAEGLVERLQQTAWHGQILGAHGSGKSALVAELISALHRAGRQVALYELHEGQRHLPPNFPPQTEGEKPLVVLIDGYEQLSRLARFRLRRQCRQLGFGLIVTAHRSVGLPELVRLQPEEKLAQKIVQWLLRDSPVRITPEEVSAAYHAQKGDLREMLFNLYDLWERRIRSFE